MIMMEMTSLVPSRTLMMNFGADSDPHSKIMMETTSLVPSRILMVNSGADLDPHSRSVMTNSKNDLDLLKMDTDLDLGSGTLIKTTSMGIYLRTLIVSMDIDMDLHPRTLATDTDLNSGTLVVSSGTGKDLLQEF